MIQWGGLYIECSVINGGMMVAPPAIYIIELMEIFQINNGQWEDAKPHLKSFVWKSMASALF